MIADNDNHVSRQSQRNLPKAAVMIRSPKTSREEGGLRRQAHVTTDPQKGKGSKRFREKIPALSPEDGSQNRSQGSTEGQNGKKAPVAKGLLEGGSGVSSDHPVNSPTQEISLSKEGNDHVNLRLNPSASPAINVEKHLYMLDTVGH